MIIKIICIAGGFILQLALLIYFLIEKDKIHNRIKAKKEISALYSIKDIDSLLETKLLIERYILQFPGDNQMQELYSEVINSIISLKIKNNKVNIQEKKMIDKKYHEEIESLKRLINLNNKNQQLISNLAQLFFIVENYDEAVYYYKKAIDIQQKYDLYFLLAECYEIKGETINAVKYYKEALRLNKSITGNDKSNKLITYKRLLQIYKIQKNEYEIKNIIKQLEKENQFNEIITALKQNHIK